MLFRNSIGTEKFPFPNLLYAVSTICQMNFQIPSRSPGNACRTSYCLPKRLQIYNCFSNRQLSFEKKPNLFSRREKQYFKEPLLFLYPNPTNIFMPVLRAANVTPFFVSTTILQCLFSIFLPYLHITLIIRPKHIPLFYTNPLKTLLPNTTNMNFR